MQVRPGDLDEDGMVSDGVLFEYLQESRIRYVMDLHTRGQSWTHHVIARTDVQYLRPMPFRAAPYAVHSWIGSVGTKSFTICAEVRDEDAVLAEATVVMVTFDKEAQRPAPMAQCAARAPGAGSSALAEVLHRVDHELRGVGDVLPELRVLLGRQVGLVERGAEVGAASGRVPSA